MTTIIGATLLHESRPVVEGSIAIRVAGCLLSIVAICSAFIFGMSPVPVIGFSPTRAAVVLIALWVCIGGSMLSYHYRHAMPKVMGLIVKQGAVLIILNLLRELVIANLHSQQFEFLYPVVDALVGACVLTSFELRTRGEILACAGFTLTLMAFAACSGRSLIFGGLVILYLIVGTTLLALVARSQTIAMPHTDDRLFSARSQGWSSPAIFMSAALLPVASLALFSLLPRLDAPADTLCAEIRSRITSWLYTAKNKSRPELQGQDPNILATLRKQKALAQLHSSTRAAAKHGEHAAQKTASSSPVPKPSSSAVVEADKRATQASGGKRGLQVTEPVSAKAAKQDPTKGKQVSKQSVPHEPPSRETKLPKQATKGAKQVVMIAPSKQNETANAAKLPENAITYVPKGGKQVMDAGQISLEKGMSMSDETVFTLACNRTVYVKLCTLDTFDGHNWSHTLPKQQNMYDVNPTVDGVDLTRCPPLWVSDAVPLMELTEIFTIKRDLGFEVLTAGAPERLSLLNQIHVDGDGNLRSANLLTKGTTYTASCRWPVYSLPEMRKSQSFADIDLTADDLERFLQMPADQSPQTIALAEHITAGGANRFVQAEKIVTYLREHCQYTMEPLKGTEDDNLADTFMFNCKKGDCKAFATSFVMLCRAVGIPSRMVAGFGPGAFDAVHGTTTVHFRDGHAWAEIFMEPYGWIPFDPTPGGQLPARSEEHHYNYSELKQQAAQNKNGWGAHVLFFIEKSAIYLGYAFALLGAVLSAVGIGMSLRVLRGLLSGLRERLRRRHPAERYKAAVLKRLRLLGVKRQRSDTGSDISENLAGMLEEQSRRRVRDTAELRQKVEQFFNVYNAVFFGNCDELLPELRQLCTAVCSLVK